MKTVPNWQRTPTGQVVRFLGSVRLAVPVMALVAVALAWGTYLESMHGAGESRATVYGAWWFIGLMALVCVSLVFAVITRYPWRRKHVGFITVHASMIALIAGGFWSLFGRQEGQLMLQAGMASDVISTDQQQIQRVRHDMRRPGHMETVAAADLSHGARHASIGGLGVHIVEYWENTRQEDYVANDSPTPRRAVELAIGHGHPLWIGERSAPVVQGLTVRLLGADQTWTPPVPAAEGAGPRFEFALGADTYPLVKEGDEVFPGWTVERLRHFERALVTADGLVEGQQGHDNPAVEIILADGKGSRERHTAFLTFPDMRMARTMEGDARSGAALIARPERAAAEELVLHGQPPALTATYVTPDGRTEEFTSDGALPWTIQCGHRRVTIVQQLTNARPAQRVVPAPKAQETRPALLVRVGDDPAAAPVVLLWKGTTDVATPGGTATLRYGPREITIPFTVRLDEFRKIDYPGTQTAMAYESDVTVTVEGGETHNARIFMNSPFQHSGWKVYQSGFIGSDISIFSVMRDPGLPLTYLACLGLCVGIVITFYSRAYSTGHPGIPVPFARKESTNAPRLSAQPPLSDDPGLAGPGGRDRTGSESLDRQAGDAPDPAGRPRHAPGHPRPAPCGAIDGAVEMVSR